MIIWILVISQIYLLNCRPAYQIPPSTSPSYVSQAPQTQYSPSYLLSTLKTQFSFDTSYPSRWLPHPLSNLSWKPSFSWLHSLPPSSSGSIQSISKLCQINFLSPSQIYHPLVIPMASTFLQASLHPSSPGLTSEILTPSPPDTCWTLSTPPPRIMCLIFFITPSPCSFSRICRIQISHIKKSLVVLPPTPLTPSSLKLSWHFKRKVYTASLSITLNPLHYPPDVLKAPPPGGCPAAVHMISS